MRRRDDDDVGNWLSAEQELRRHYRYPRSDGSDIVTDWNYQRSGTLNRINAEGHRL
jgi:hypothetical protein